MMRLACELAIFAGWLLGAGQMVAAVAAFSGAAVISWVAGKEEER